MKFFIFCYLFTLSISLSSQDLFSKRLADSAFTLTKTSVVYNPTYFSIPYPNGDIPSNSGVCTDVIIRTFRKVGIDLQKEVHEDMLKNFSQYPKQWNMKRTDSNIDHRRVPNLMTFFNRFGKTKIISYQANDYIPGDIVCWNLGKSITHIGIVSNLKSSDNLRYLIIHNIGKGQELSDCLFSYKIIGHYSYGK